MKEIWKDIEGYEGYYMISNMGEVNSVARDVMCRNQFTSWIEKKPCVTLKPQWTRKKRYHGIVLWKNRKSKEGIIHRLVAQAFIPNPENKPEVNHKNGIKTDNRVENLEWCTALENSRHAWKTGLNENCRMSGERNGRAKLNNKQVLEIRSKYIPFEYSQRKLAKEYSVSQPIIGSIISRASWKHI